ncbi:MAG: isoprenylcysteine carboxylmethyltransferase family protein [Opitutaceae bacterium]|nr:isoprenylcysteine carboxylmethyltransferase family protein [Opitutaceae bacterium]
MTVEIIHPSTPPSFSARFARWRKPISRVFAAGFVGLLVLTTSPGTSLSVLVLEIVGLLLIIAAVLGRIWCALYIAGRKNTELCCDGPYSVCRNPLYVFSFFGVVGLALVARSAPLGLIIAPIFWGYHHFVISSEETRLRELFGEAYNKYYREVPRLWPSFRLYWSRPSLVIDPRVIGRALSEVAWFLIAVACLEIVEHMRGASLGEAKLPVLFTWSF